jgi:hypothetical protein
VLDDGPYVINKKTAKKLNKLKSVKATATSLIRSKQDIGLLSGLSQYVEYYKGNASPKHIQVTYATPEKISRDKVCVVPPESRLLSLQPDNSLSAHVICDVNETLDVLFNTPSKWE